MKLRNKLILSCAALAAVATTAVSTTFAWYTANDTVKANGITGKTSNQDATLLLISKTGKQGQWGASVDLNTSGVTLDPVAYMKADKYVKATAFDEDVTYYGASGAELDAQPADADEFAAGTFYVKKEAGKYYQWDSAANQEGAEAAGGTESGQYISFYLYFKSGSSQSLDVTIDKFNLRNTTSALPTNTVLAAGTGSSSSSYSIDMLRATNIVITTYQGKEVEATASANPTIPSTATSTQAVRTAYACDTAVKKVKNSQNQDVDWDSYVAETNTGTADEPVYSGSNAHRYYNNVKTLTGADALPTTVTTSEASLGSVATLVGDDTHKYTFTVQTGAGATANGGLDNILMVKFDIYLDGWDVACFDACRKQTFALDMEFTGTPHKEQQSGGN